MTNKIIGLALCSLLLAPCSPLQAQQAGKGYQIGYLAGTGRRTESARMEAFRQALRELGLVEGKNVVIEPRYAQGKLDRLPTFVADLVRLKVDIILSAGPTTTRLAKKETLLIPIVMAQDPDPVGNGFVASLARPTGNITGLSSLAPEISGKQLELLKQAVPKLSRVTVIGESASPGNTQALREVELAARAFGVTLQYLDISDRKDVWDVFRTASEWQTDAILALGGSLLISLPFPVVNLAVKSRLPAIYNVPEFVEAGGLMSYGVNVTDLYRRAATYVDKILKGAKPADLPVEQPTKFELVVNLKAAKQIGLTIPPSLLARADRVIR